MESTQIYLHDDEFHHIVNDEQLLKRCTEDFLNAIIDKLTLGIIFDSHKRLKVRSFDLDGSYWPAEERSYFPENTRSPCACPVCNKEVSPNGFAGHLQTCMKIVIPTKGLRSTTRRAVNNNNKDNETNQINYDDAPSDDEKDEDYTGRTSSRKKKQKNGGKKGRVTPKKRNQAQHDLMGDDSILQDHSNQTSSADSTTSNTSKKKSKAKKK